jgi:hypothetical protein
LLIVVAAVTTGYFFFKNRHEYCAEPLHLLGLPALDGHLRQRRSLHFLKVIRTAGSLAFDPP